MRLTIRADCSPTIGTGHVMRMIALGQAWKTMGGEVSFLGDTSLLTSRLETEGFKTTQLPQESIDDAQALIRATHNNEWVAIDGYHFGPDYQKQIREAGRKTLVLDDVCDRESYHADILLNQNPDAASYPYNINDDAILLQGTQYTLLRDEFQRFPKQRKVAEKIRNVLVTMGGADPTNMTMKVLGAINAQDGNKLHIKVVAGAANLHLASLEKQTEALGPQYELLTNVKDIPALMNWADLAISAAGSTCWELCYFGLPMIAIMVAENQQGVRNELERHEAALCLDSNPEEAQISQKLRALLLDQPLRKALSDNAQKLIDGKGALRVAKAIYTSGVVLRQAHAEDSKMLLDWRNDPTVRAKSFNSEVIEYEEHDRWFSAKLADINCLFFIAHDQAGQPVGQFRFDIDNGEALVSINVAPGMTNRGLGTSITTKACQELTRHNPDCKAVALVKSDNPGSAAMFLKSGFIQIPTGNTDFLRFEWKDDKHPV